jgi:hypothetical protein
MGIPAKLRNSGNLARPGKIHPRSLGRLANVLPALEVSKVAFRSAKVAHGLWEFSS